MTLRTARLILRPFAMSDAPRITELICDPEVIGMLEQPPWPYQLEDAQFWLAGMTERQRTGSAHNFAVDLPGTGLVGSIGLQKKKSELLDLGYWIGKPYWGKGFAGEAATAIMIWAQSVLDIQELESGYFEDNPASGKILSRLGFQPTGCNCTIENAVRAGPVTCIGMHWQRNNGW
jgi:RimJ/RimL family protein N-acetyltransferase